MEIVVGTSGFTELGRYLSRLLPQARIRFADGAALGGLVREADILIPSMARVDESVLDQAPRLLLIQQWGAGLEGVDVAAATRRGIPVANVPTRGTGNAISVAEWCVMAALALARRLDEARANARAGSPWGAPAGLSLWGRVAGIVGLGGIGQALAPMLRALGMRVRAVKRSPQPELARTLGLEALGSMEQLDDLLSVSDFVFVALPVTQETRGLMDARRLAAMKPGSYLINAARGALVDEEALLRALDSGHLAGAALDVFAQEPAPAGHPLVCHPRVLATAHVAGVTDLSYADIARRVADNIRRVLAGELPEPCVNPEVRRRGAAAGGPAGEGR